MFYWDPDPVVFTLPIIDHPVRWYGVLFASGFIAGYFLLVHIFTSHLKDRKKALEYVDGLTIYIVLGTIIGARLGDVFFYDWHIYRHDLWGIFRIWEGGLASHGGTVGVAIALFIGNRRLLRIPYLTLVDLIVIPTALVAVFIRLGNFFNQEILGHFTYVPWAVLFGTPMDGSLPQPRHPAQLYEAFLYLTIFCTLITIWSFKRQQIRQGFFSGLFFITVFLGRSLIEFVKIPQSSFTSDGSSFLMGQYLSIPFVVVGIALLIYSKSSKLVSDFEVENGEGLQNNR